MAVAFDANAEAAEAIASTVKAWVRKKEGFSGKIMANNLKGDGEA
ncbi:hypothetical protein [Bradyrhizobium sp. DASA03120]